MNGSAPKNGGFKRLKKRGDADSGDDFDPQRA